MARIKVIGDGTPAGTSIFIDGKLRNDIMGISFGIGSDDIIASVNLIMSVDEVEVDLDDHNLELVHETLTLKAKVEDLGEGGKVVSILGPKE